MQYAHYITASKYMQVFFKNITHSRKKFAVLFM